jgi:hypothetical protein
MERAGKFPFSAGSMGSRTRPAPSPAEYRAIQVGLSGEAVIRYADDWIQQITDVTGTMRAIGTLVAADRLGEAPELLPEERPYALSEELAKAVGSTV